MAIKHVNRRGDTYYLHEGKTKTGKPKYHFSKKAEGNPADAVPPGYEIYENPNSQVFLRKIQPKAVTDEEIALVEKGVRHNAGLSSFIVDVKNDSIIVYTPNQSSEDLERLFGDFLLPFRSARIAEVLQQIQNYSPMMKFTLANAETRMFTVQRWCFRGSIDDWISLIYGRGALEDLVAKYTPHLGKESFFELM